MLLLFLFLPYVLALTFIMPASIATSSGSASAYVKEGMTNIRLGMFLEIATSIGAVLGAAVALWMPTNAIAIVFGVVLLLTIALQFRQKTDYVDVKGSRLAMKLKLFGSYPTKDGKQQKYELTNVTGGFSVMVLAGALSGLLGIGRGALKVLAMDGCMKVPFKVSTTTSNFMIGVTAVTSAVVYLQRGYIEPGIAFPIIVGVLAGAMSGAKLLKRLDVRLLRKIFSVAILLAALNMIYNGIIGKF